MPEEVKPYCVIGRDGNTALKRKSSTKLIAANLAKVPEVAAT